MNCNAETASNSALLQWCRIYHEHRDSIVTLLRTGKGFTREQGVALERLIDRWERAPDEVQIGIVGEPKVLMARWGNLWIGIETDGYAHS